MKDDLFDNNNLEATYLNERRINSDPKFKPMDLEAINTWHKVLARELPFNHTAPVNLQKYA